MLDKQQIRSIHIAKSRAGLDDAAYRALLNQAAGAASSKDERLGENDYQAIMRAINGVQDTSGARRDGWQFAQINKFRQYCKYCAMDATEARRMLFKITGQMHEESPGLVQADFDDAMAAIEEELEKRIRENTNPCITYNNNGLDLRYWRDRHPRKGGVNTRERKKLLDEWEALQQYFPEEKRNMRYLHGFIAHVCNLSRAKPLEQLSSHQALKVIDALSKRREQESVRRTANLI